jgi:integrase
MIRALLRCGLKAGRDVTNVRRVLDLCGMFELPKKNGVQPNPISPNDFRKLLDAADVKWRAVLLLTLNCCLYPSEVSHVKKADLDLTAGTYSATRAKTGIARVGVLWKRTIKAIKAYQAEEPHHSPFVFVSREGAPWTAQGFNYAFGTLRTRAGVNVQFASIRDAAFTEAIKAGLDQGRWLAGHRGGQADAYVRRSPELVREACKAIESAFFA